MIYSHLPARWQDFVSAHCQDFVPVRWKDLVPARWQDLVPACWQDFVVGLPPPKRLVGQVQPSDSQTFSSFSSSASFTVSLPENRQIRLISLWKYSSVFRENRYPPPPKPVYGGSFSHETVTLQIRSRSPKSNKLLILCDLYRLANLVTFHPMVHELTYRQGKWLSFRRFTSKLSWS